MNALVQPYVAGVQAAAYLPLYDPRAPRDSRSRFRRDALPALGRANSLYVPSGRWPARGWLLVARSDYNNLNPYSDSLQLQIGDPKRPDNVGILQNLSVVQARCVTRGLATDSNALYLVEVCDDRSILHNDWFQAPATAFYNVRAPAYPQAFYTGSLSGGTVAWTWSTMLQDLWQQMNVLDGGNILGPWPGLPSAPVGAPEGWVFPGVPAWHALNDVLDHLGMTVACDLQQTNPFTIVNVGDDDNAFQALQTKYAGRLEDDLEWQDVGAGRVPGSVKVLFRRRNSVYGTEEAVRADALQWETSSYYTVAVNAPPQFTGAVGVGFLWSDFTVRYDQDGVPLAADTATANTIAAERVAQFFAKIYRAQGFMTQMYGGALPFVTGSMVDGVKWSMDFRDGRAGWVTQIVRGQFPAPWSEVWE